MQNRMMALHADTHSPTGRYVGIGFVVTLHLVVIWAILNALNFHISKIIPPVTTFHVVQTQVQQPQPVPPPPKPVLQQPTHIDTVPPPIIHIQQQATQNPVTVAPSTQPTIQPQQQPQSSTPDSAASAVGSTHTTPPYPPTARRMGQQGTVTLLLSIDTSGAVTNAQVKASSGSSALDQEAESWVVSHWRYKPAVKDGSPVPSTTLAAVKFDLKQAG